MSHDVHAAADHIAKHPHGRARYEALFNTVQQQIAADIEKAKQAPTKEEAIAVFERGHKAYSQHKSAVLDKISG